MNDPHLSIAKGEPYPLGATCKNGGINFSIHVHQASRVFLRLFKEEERERPFTEIAINPLTNKSGEIWHLFIDNLASTILYQYRVEREDSTLLLLDPYAKGIRAHFPWGNCPTLYAPLGKVLPFDPFDWEGVQPPKVPFNDLIIYEMHLRGFTRSPSSQTLHSGTYLGLIEKIPYLKQLGINAVELLPMHEFNEREVINRHPNTGEILCNYFGYSTVNFFSPMSRYATDPSGPNPVDEFKLMVRELHKNGIEVILDVVYNHTFEGGDEGLTESYRGLNNAAYYMLDKQGKNLNYSGCGNTFNGNHPIASELILHSIRYWVQEFHIDGFRFDLASIFNRNEEGAILTRSPLVEAISVDPLLTQTKLIAEAWDAGGLYQVGSFVSNARWSEWNGKYRDVVRRFIKGTPATKKAFATALCGSQDLYGWRYTPLCSVNFITSHDGFTLADLVAYNVKHNLENGENNRDGADHNESWNCGIEGETANKKIVNLRLRQMKNFHLALMISQGVPMISMGDEYGHSKFGNNNTWCQDNDLNWFQWNRLEEPHSFFHFYRSLIHFRKEHPLLGRRRFLDDQTISWHGLFPHQPDWENDNRLIAFTLNQEDQTALLYIAFNAAEKPQTVTLPLLKKGQKWQWVVNTENEAPYDYFEENNRLPLTTESYKMASHSAIMLRVS